MEIKTNATEQEERKRANAAFQRWFRKKGERNQANEDFEVFYQLSSPRVYNIACGLIRNRAIADEVVENTFTALICKNPADGPIHDPWAWVMGNIFYKCREHARDARRLKLMPDEILNEVPGPNMDRDPRLEQLQTFLDEMPRLWRECLELSRFSSLKAKEASQVLDVSVDEYYECCRKARNFLRKKFELPGNAAAAALSIGSIEVLLARPTFQVPSSLDRAILGKLGRPVSAGLQGAGKAAPEVLAGAGRSRLVAVLGSSGALMTLTAFCLLAIGMLVWGPLTEPTRDTGMGTSTGVGAPMGRLSHAIPKSLVPPERRKKSRDAADFSTIVAGSVYRTQLSSSMPFELEKAQVTVYFNDGKSQEGMTDAQGVYSIPVSDYRKINRICVAAGRSYTIFTGTRETQNSIFCPEFCNIPPVVLEPAVTVSGRVVDSDGVGVSGACVTLKPLRHPENFVVQTKVDGTFEVPYVPEDTYHAETNYDLVVAKSGSFKVSAAADALIQNITIEPFELREFQLTPKFLNSADAVSVDFKGAVLKIREKPVTIDNAEGKFKLAVPKTLTGPLADGLRSVRGVMPGGAERFIATFMLTGNELSPEVRTPVFPMRSLTVLTSEPAFKTSKLTIHVENSPTDQILDIDNNSKVANLQFRLNAFVPPGATKVVVWAFAEGFAPARFTVSPTGTEDTIELTRGFQVSGTVLLPDGTSAKFAPVVVRSGATVLAETMTRDDGTFTIDALPAQKLEVSSRCINGEKTGSISGVPLNIVGDQPSVQMDPLTLKRMYSLKLSLSDKMEDSVFVLIRNKNLSGQGSRPSAHVLNQYLTHGPVYDCGLFEEGEYEIQIVDPTPDSGMLKSGWLMPLTITTTTSLELKDALATLVMTVTTAPVEPKLLDVVLLTPFPPYYQIVKLEDSGLLLVNDIDPGEYEFAVVTRGRVPADVWATLSGANSLSKNELKLLVQSRIRSVAHTTFKKSLLGNMHLGAEPFAVPCGPVPEKIRNYPDAISFSPKPEQLETGKFRDSLGTYTADQIKDAKFSLPAGNYRWEIRTASGTQTEDCAIVAN